MRREGVLWTSLWGREGDFCSRVERREPRDRCGLLRSLPEAVAIPPPGRRRPQWRQEFLWSLEDQACYIGICNLGFRPFDPFELVLIHHYNHHTVNYYIITISYYIISKLRLYYTDLYCILELSVLRSRIVGLQGMMVSNTRRCAWEMVPKHGYCQENQEQRRVRLILQIAFCALHV